MSMFPFRWREKNYDTWCYKENFVRRQRKSVLNTHNFVIITLLNAPKDYDVEDDVGE